MFAALARRVASSRRVVFPRSRVFSTSGIEHSSNSDVERHIASLNREIRRLYVDHQHETAIECAEELREIALNHYGQKHPVYASALNNLGLLNKSLGNYDKAMEFYTNSVIHYEDSVGKEHPSTITAIHNVGLTYKDMAANNTGLTKLDFLEKSKDVLKECLGLREKVLDRGHQDTAVTMSALALVKNSLNEQDEAVAMMVESAEMMKEQENTDGRINAAKTAATSTIFNNLGYLLKSQGKYDLSKEAYFEALERRKSAFGIDHPNTLVTMQNISELERAMGNEEGAVRIQQEIIDIVERADQENKTE